MIKKIITTISHLLLSMLVFGGVAFVITYIVYYGLFIKWEKIENPIQGDKIIGLIDVGNFKTQSGDKYYLDESLILTKGDQSSNRNMVIKAPESSCRTFPFLPTYDPSFVEERKSCIHLAFGYATLATALDKNGNLYIWNNNQMGEFSGVELILFPALASILGLILAGIYMIGKKLLGFIPLFLSQLYPDR